MKLQRIVIKPTLSCTAKCPTCALRLELHETLRREPSLGVEAWQAVITQARELGCMKLDISGGEPTLYAELERLVQFGARLGMFTNVNTNGSRLTSELLGRLTKAKLDSVTISIYSTHADLHDQMHNEHGLHNRAIQAVTMALKQDNLVVNLQSIMSRENILGLDSLITMAYELGVSNLYLSYVEGDTGQRWLPIAAQIHQFRRSVLPNMLRIVMQRAPEDHKVEVCERVGTLFADDRKRQMELERGHYFPSSKPVCYRPSRFALILANGDVHPCNGVEYNHDPVVGNVREQSLLDLWYGDRWQRFREERHDWCHFCPMALHIGIPILPDQSIHWPGEWGHPERTSQDLKV